LVLSLAALALAACSGGGSGGRAGGPFDASFTKLDGSPTSFAAYRGTPLVVNFYASTCGPCVQEMPALQRLHQQLGDRVRFLGLDVQETVATAQSFADAMKVTWDLGRDPDGSILSTKVGAKGMPSTLLIAPDGTIVQRWLNGAVDINELTKLIHDKGYA
jgi:thiol-disulfide isomerase/thioredoxin